jgi:hypothetical protein
MIVPSNRWPVNQAALRWLKAARDPVRDDMSYLVQLAWWGLENGVSPSQPNSPSQPDRNDLELALGRRLKAGAPEAATATRWVLANPDLNPQETANNLRSQLDLAKSPQEAASLVVETVFERMAAVNSMSQA